MMKGNGFLKVTSILMVIGGLLALASAITIITTFMAQEGIAITDAEGKVLVDTGSSMYKACSMAGSVLLIVGAVMEFVSGIMGLKSSANPARVKKCVAMGVIVIAICIVANVILLIGTDVIQLFGLIANVVLPLVYVAAALQTQKQ